MGVSYYLLRVLLNNNKKKDAIFKNLIYKKKKAFDINLIVSLIFFMVMIQNIISFFQYKQIYFVFAAIGIFITITMSTLKARLQTRIYENGIFMDLNVIKYDEFIEYHWSEARHQDKSTLSFIAPNHFYIYRRKRFKYSIVLDRVHRDKIQRCLDKKGC